MPAGILAEIESTGDLRVGVDQNTLGFGWRDRNGQLEGFDISLAEEIGLAMFGEPGHVDLVPVTSRERIGAVDDGHVDLVISVMTITCERAGQVAFSTEYFRAHQRVLVRDDSDIETIEDLAGRTVCATATSTSLDNLADFAPDAVPLRGGGPDGLPGRAPAGRWSTRSPPTTRSCSASWPRTRSSACSRIGSPRSSTASPSTATTTDLVRFVNGVLERCVPGDGEAWAELLAAARPTSDVGCRLDVTEPPPAVGTGLERPRRRRSVRCSVCCSRPPSACALVGAMGSIDESATRRRRPPPRRPRRRPPRRPMRPSRA